MTVNVTQLVPATQLTNAAAVYYTTPANTIARIDRAIFSNTTSGAVTITVNLVASGGSVSAANQVITTLSIAANTTYVSPELAGQVLPAGATLQALASANTSIVISVSGITVS